MEGLTRAAGGLKEEDETTCETLLDSLIGDEKLLPDAVLSEGTTTAKRTQPSPVGFHAGSACSVCVHLHNFVSLSLFCPPLVLSSEMKVSNSGLPADT